MSQDDAPAFAASEFLELCGNGFGDAAEAFYAAEFTALDGYVSTHRLGAFGDDDDSVGLAVIELALEVGSDVLDGVGNFWDQDGVGAPGESGVESDPSGVATHDLDHHDATVRMRGAVQAVNAVSGERDRGVEAERQRCGLEVVVDGLGHAHDTQPLLVKLVGDGEAAVATDGDDGIDVMLADATDDLVGKVHFFP